MRKSTRSAIRYEDSDGNPLIKVPVSKYEDATLNAADYDAIQAKGFTGHFYLNNNGSGINYVRAYGRSTRENNEMVARLVTGATKGQIVRHKDKNRLNLRRSNLEIVDR